MTSSLLVFIPHGWSVEKTLNAQEIIRRSDTLLRRPESYAEITMRIKRPEWTRTLTLEAWTQGSSNSLMRVLSPKKEKDVTFLKRGREAWQYIPSVDRIIKIPPSMMLQSWMGSDFTNDDIVRTDSLVVDYTHRIASEPEQNGIAYWLIESSPKPNAAVVWGKIELKIRKQNFVADRVDFFDEDGERMKYYQAFDIKRIENMDVATRLTMYNLSKPGYSTSLTYNELTFHPDVRPSTFSVHHLKR